MEHDDMIGRYLEGRLSSEARVEFERLMEEDSVLAREVRAEGAIRRTLGSHPVPLPGNIAEPSSAIMAKLRSTPAQPSTLPAPQSPAGNLAQTVSEGASGIGSSTILGAIFGTTLGVAILSLVGVAGVVLGIFLVAPLLRSSGKPTAQPAAPAAIGTIQPAVPAASVSSGSPKENAEASSANPPLGQDPKSGRENRPLSVKGLQREGEPRSAESRSGNNDPAASENAAQSGQAKRKEEMLDYLRRQKEAATPRVVRKDSLKLKFEMEE